MHGIIQIILRKNGKIGIAKERKIISTTGQRFREGRLLENWDEVGIPQITIFF